MATYDDDLSELYYRVLEKFGVEWQSSWPHGVMHLLLKNKVSSGGGGDTGNLFDSFKSDQQVEAEAAIEDQNKLIADFYEGTHAESKPAKPPQQESKPAKPPQQESKPAKPPQQESKPAKPPQQESKPAKPPQQKSKRQWSEQVALAMQEAGFKSETLYLDFRHADETTVKKLLNVDQTNAVEMIKTNLKAFSDKEKELRKKLRVSLRDVIARSEKLDDKKGLIDFIKEAALREYIRRAWVQGVGPPTSVPWRDEFKGIVKVNDVVDNERVKQAWLKTAKATGLIDLLPAKAVIVIILGVMAQDKQPTIAKVNAFVRSLLEKWNKAMLSKKPCIDVVNNFWVWLPEHVAVPGGAYSDMDVNHVRGYKLITDGKNWGDQLHPETRIALSQILPYAKGVK